MRLKAAFAQDSSVTNSSSGASSSSVCVEPTVTFTSLIEVPPTRPVGLALWFSIHFLRAGRNSSACFVGSLAMVFTYTLRGPLS